MFREYDIRGVYNSELFDRDAELIGKAFGTLLLKRGESSVLVARDCRVSSPPLSKALISGLQSTGCKVIDIGIASWGLINYALRQKSNRGNAVFVSASHNPAKYNGFKLVAKGHSLAGKEIRSLLELITANSFATGTGSLSVVEYAGEYIEFLKSKIQLKRKVKFVVDYGNGMGALVGSKLFKQLGCEVTELYPELDGSFPNHLADPSVVENLQDLIAAVKKNKAEFGIAFDGDGDRIGAVDEKGSIMWGDQLTAIFAKDILKTKPRTKIAFEVRCSRALPEVIKANNGIAIECQCGHSLIEETLRREKALLAGEMSGHVFFADDFYGIDDAVYVALRLIEIISNLQADCPVSSLLSDYPRYFASKEYRPFCPDGEKRATFAAIAKEFEAEGSTVSKIDGAKAIFPDGWGLIRVSNTQPALSLRFEGTTLAAMQRIQKLFADKLTKHGIELTK